MTARDWETKGDTMISILWKRVLDQAAMAGITVPESVGTALPPELEKMKYFEDILGAFIEHDPSNGSSKNFGEYVDRFLARKLGWKREKGVANTKQQDLFTINTSPRFTKVAEKYSWDQLREHFATLSNTVRKDDGWQKSKLKEEFVGDGINVEKVLGLSNPAFIVGHASVVAGRSNMPWTVTDSSGKVQPLPMPFKYYKHGARAVLREMDLGENSYLKPGHLLIGSSGSGGSYADNQGTAKISNTGGAAGYPYTRIDNARRITSDGNRATKGNVAREELKHILKWLKAGMPTSGPLWRRIAQPNTMWKRGDAQVRMSLSIFATALKRAGYPLLGLLLPGRGIVIVATIQVILESVFVNPMMEALYDHDVKTVDMRTKRFTKEQMAYVIQSVLARIWRAAGLDVSRWDMNMYPGEHGIEAALNGAMFAPGLHKILIGAASMPALWQGPQIEEMMRVLEPGESMVVEVEVPRDDSTNNRVEKVEVTALAINIRELIAKTIMAVNGSGISMGGYKLPVAMYDVPVPREILGLNDPEYSDTSYEGIPETISVHGCRRSGSLGTSDHNSRLNGVVLHGGHQMLRDFRRNLGLINKRASHFGIPQLVSTSKGPADPYFLRRGDDAVAATADRYTFSNGQGTIQGNLDIVGPLIYALSGRYANSAKQKTGDWGVPELEFSSEYYDATFPGGITSINRTLTRVLTEEGSTGGLDRMRMDDEETYDLGLVSDTLTAKARLMPQRGGLSLGNETPGSNEIIMSVAALDKFGLTYGMTQDKAELAARVRGEARRHARREALKHNMSEKHLPELEEEYLNHEIHSVLAEGYRRRTLHLGDALLKPRKSGAGVEWIEQQISALAKKD